MSNLTSFPFTTFIYNLTQPYTTQIIVSLWLSHFGALVSALRPSQSFCADFFLQVTLLAERWTLKGKSQIKRVILF